MIRTAASFVLSFILLIVESSIVIHIRNFDSLVYDDLSLLAGVLSINFLLSFSILTELKNWITEHYNGSDSEIHNH